MPDVWERFVGKMDGRFHPAEPDRFQKTIRDLAGKYVEVAIRPERGKRTLDQNAYLHVVAREVSKASGESEDRIKQLAVLESLGLEAGTTKTVLLGREFLNVRSTSSLRKHEASKVLDWLLDKAAFLEVRLPNREQVQVME